MVQTSELLGVVGHARCGLGLVLLGSLTILELGMRGLVLGKQGLELLLGPGV